MHSDMADAGTYSNEQLRDFKRQAGARSVEGRFEWLRRHLLIRIGSNFYFDTPVILTHRDQPLVWFTRDDESHVLLNFRFLTLSRDPRIEMQESYWLLPAPPDGDFVCPPSGRLIDVRYLNGDHLRVELIELESVEDARSRFPEDWRDQDNARLPVACAEISFSVGGTDMAFTPEGATIGGSMYRHCTFTSCGPISIGPNPAAMHTISEATIFGEQK
jgi:hypothetical protein